ncbi:hypothetical protein LZP85_07440 [Priestia flexa]|uniref:Uncharacterized protein n=1 Tax=Priestia flexa TaxID=86664 RepID=A0A8I1MER1_9BACI|nr:hypothetical protein [Priestia flexa]MBN8251501.1 hypothetical protein [Priestia flexa]MBN8434235.1 hypothetical protein [Priestia flexa]MCA0966981.1 hypothetical protein [Priestia flexa]UIR31606.1 hypothetical protein LZP85_07440 [Priestia flexa]UZW65636.1 hypothetical protein OC195_16365 [Priestia flexa]
MQQAMFTSNKIFSQALFAVNGVSTRLLYTDLRMQKAGRFLEQENKFKNKKEAEVYRDLIKERYQTVKDYYQNEYERKDQVRKQTKEAIDKQIKEQSGEAPSSSTND